MCYAQSVLCVTGGNSVSSSRRNGPPPFGGLSVAAIISWYFSDSTNPFIFRLSSFHLDHIISSGYNDKDVYRRSAFNDTWYILCNQIHSQLIWIFLNINSISTIHNFRTRIQALCKFKYCSEIRFYLSANIKYFIDHCLHHIAVKYIH